MRKYFSGIMLLLAFSFLAACDVVSDSKSEQTEALEVGEIILFGAVHWRVLAIYDDETALIVSENIIASMPYYHTAFSDIAWENSDVRMHLNSMFLDTFSYEERSRILPKFVHTPDNWRYMVRGGEDTTDYLFLLSIEEVAMYFCGGEIWSPSPPGQPTHLSKWLIDDKYNSTRTALDETGAAASWWLRSPGFDIDFTAIVSYDGIVHIDGAGVNINKGIRPALLLDISDDA